MPLQLDLVTYRKDLKWPIGHGYGPVIKGGPATRDAAHIRTILIHTTNSLSGNTNYRPEAIFLRDSSDVSTHYVVSSHNVAAVQVLPDSYIAWHAGDCADADYENPTSIGVEIAWVPQAGPLPAIAVANVTELVSQLVQRYPHITKIDMHRAQAAPRGRKVDPSGWESADFYRWRDQVLGRAPAPPSPDSWATWGTRHPLPVEQRVWGIPALWHENASWLGEARSEETYLADGRMSVRVFQGGLIWWEKTSGRCTLGHFVTRLL